MVRRAYGTTLGEDEIEDVYANAWMGTLRALENRQASMDDEEIRRYVFTAVAHQAGKELRRRRRRPIAPLERAAAVADRSAPPEEQADQHEQSQITRDLLSSLPRRRRAVLLLRYGWGLEPAQVCELIEGLSPRAYRKEITRGVDELTDKIRTLERGGWCAEREPILKAFAAGIADAEQERQAQYHLSHCRPCSEFVGKLSGHLHDLGTATAVPAIDLAADGHVSAPDPLADLVERARDSVSGVFAKAGASASDGALASLPSAAPRGAGAAGAGLIAKLAGVGVAGKAVLACVTGGVVATVCVVVGVGPGLDPVRESRPDRPAAERTTSGSRANQLRGILPSQVGSTEAPAPPAPAAPVEEPPGNTEPTPAEPTLTEPPPVPAEVQQFGEAPAMSSPSPSGSGGSGDTATATEREFGP
jgi:RNA polymerase sigma factor (sigma-70 family)